MDAPTLWSKAQQESEEKRANEASEYYIDEYYVDYSLGGLWLDPMMLEVSEQIEFKY